MSPQPLPEITGVPEVPEILDVPKVPEIIDAPMDNEMIVVRHAALAGVQDHILDSAINAIVSDAADELLPLRASSKQPAHAEPTAPQSHASDLPSSTAEADGEATRSHGKTADRSSKLDQQWATDTTLTLTIDLSE